MPPPDPRRRRLLPQIAALAGSSVTDEGGDEASLFVLLRGAVGFCYPLHGILNATLECRTRGGLATLCGFAEYTTPSNPPRYFLTQTASGAFYQCAQYEVIPNFCASANHYRANYEYAGAYQYSAADCSTSDTGSVTKTETTQLPDPPVGCGSGPAPILVGSSALGAAWSPQPGEYFNLTQTPTQQHWTGVGCHNDINTISDVFSTLTDQDTDAAAITRLFNANPWGAWLEVDDTCFNPPCCTSSRQVRTGQDFSYQIAEFRATASGLNHNEVYCVAVDTYVSPFAAGTWTLLSTKTYAVNTDGAGALVVTDAVDSQPGYDFYVTNARVFLNP